ncbi:hypothetical protein SAMN05444422_103443 [Halobiforma haloterrestris]|uniref:Uncharacterized protein n=1 Tax=Natronobacterium haloterrestre TaxID=148448 RepID=A0A1I1FLU2_NATHA|nr:hypothetical protein [Halobiforma haloterrestris]SFC00251.1 hypothetical protein SAMN05444422_103443 [Halobiforma haloterrestris]
MPKNHDTETTRTGPSRRRVLEYGGVAVTGGIVGTTGATGATGDDANEAPTEGESSSSPSPHSTVDGAMFAYQYAPGRVSVAERDLEWRPSALAPSYRTHVVSYERSPSLRAFLFTDGGLSAETDGNGFDTFALRDVSGCPAGSGSVPLTGVELEFELELEHE